MTYIRDNPLPADVLVPVPLHPKRLRQRGYNQSALLAREVGKGVGLSMMEGVLVRSKDSPPQASSRGIEERRRNVEGVFACSSKALEGLRVLLVDDVCTTGSTLSACAQALKSQGASSVWGLVVAREA